MNAADKNAQLVRLSEHGRFWRLGFDELSRAEQVFRAIWELEGDVNNGGFDQYIFNGSGDTAFAVVEALEAVGAEQAEDYARSYCFYLETGRWPGPGDSRPEL